RTNQIHGIIPDIEVPIRPGATEEELFRIREADKYYYAITNTEGADWKSNRPQQLEQMKAMSQNGRAERMYRRDSLDERSDYQLLNAVEVLDCERLLTAI